MGIFNIKKRQYGTLYFNFKETDESKPCVPDGTWFKCDKCGKLIHKKELYENLKVCTKCHYHFRLGAYERIEQICDKGSFIEFYKNMGSNNPMDFENYEVKLKANKEKCKISEAVVIGAGKIKGNKSIIAVMDSNFLMGSMGTIVGEKITLAIEKATRENRPIVIFTTSGGARMQEGIFSLMQMAKVSAALAKHSEKGLFYLTILTDPTTGGVTASFAMQGDIIIAEPGALVGFAGKRVIESTLRQKLPEDFQSAEYLLENGFVDSIVSRDKLKETISMLLEIHKTN